ncbi:MAG: stalk domain-containing protein, partial [Armatimonadota bacterium]
MQMRVTVLLMVMILAAGAAGADAQGVEVFVHGEQMDAEPGARVVDSVAYAPLRAISEAVGAEVTWLKNRQTAVVCKNNRCVDITREQAVEVDGHLLVPVRLLAEAIQMKVDWYAETRQIGIRDADSVVGMKAMPLSLPGVDGHYERDTYDDVSATVIVFWANHCPTVKAYEDRFI